MLLLQNLLYMLLLMDHMMLNDHYNCMKCSFHVDGQECRRVKNQGHIPTKREDDTSGVPKGRSAPGGKQEGAAKEGAAQEGVAQESGGTKRGQQLFFDP